MSIVLKLKHVEGVKLRCQSATKVDGKLEWKFDHEPCKQDEDARKVEADGSHVKLGTYTVYLTANLKNLVIEKAGKVEHFDFKNGSLRNQLRVKYQRLVDVHKGKEGKKPHYEWQPEGQPQYVPANTFTGVFIGDGQRAIVDEMPT